MFSKKTPKNLIYIIIVFFAFFIFFSRSDAFQSLKFQLVRASAGPAKILSFPLLEIKKILFYHRTFNEYKRLSQEVEYMRSRLIGMDEVVKENARLEDLLNFKRKLLYPSVAANVIGRDPSYWNSIMTIDVGKEDGVQQGFPVVNAYGVIGKISEVSQNTSKVILLTDPQFSATALVQRSRESGLVTGSLQGMCRMKYINEKADVVIGDKVITSKLSSSFPEGLLIGEVVGIEENAKTPSIICQIRPSVSFSQIEEVLVVIAEK